MFTKILHTVAKIYLNCWPAKYLFKHLRILVRNIAYLRKSYVMILCENNV